MLKTRYLVNPISGQTITQLEPTNRAIFCNNYNAGNTVFLTYVYNCILKSSPSVGPPPFFSSLSIQQVVFLNNLFPFLRRSI